ncbi:MAG: glycosyltransferase [Verrucomicrobia bacterium]|nr:glycosyltransferase [Verrucomicrobiota bacterium]MDA1086526.1 glycosyltransferase [Verrucomicrobiota bacterium]
MSLDFSIIVPAHRRPESLRRCLEALDGQDYPRERYEVVVVDDGSPDPLEPLVHDATRGLRIRFERQAQQGPGPARNAGALVAHGQWLAFTDDDCVPQPGWLSAFARQFERSPTALLGGTTFNSLPANPYAEASQVLTSFLYEYFNSTDHSAPLFTGNNMAAPRDLFQVLGGFSPLLKSVGSEDRELCDHWNDAGLPHEFVQDARVAHARDTTFRGFWRQHHVYGRGAPHYHRIRAARRSERGNGRTPEPVTFYLRLVTCPFRTDGWLRGRSWRNAALIVMAQVAYISGALRESILLRRREPEPEPAPAESADA